MHEKKWPHQKFDPSIGTIILTSEVLLQVKCIQFRKCTSIFCSDKVKLLPASQVVTTNMRCLILYLWEKSLVCVAFVGSNRKTLQKGSGGFLSVLAGFIQVQVTHKQDRYLHRLRRYTSHVPHKLPTLISVVSGAGHLWKSQLSLCWLTTLYSSLSASISLSERSVTLDSHSYSIPTTQHILQNAIASFKTYCKDRRACYHTSSSPQDISLSQQRIDFQAVNTA